MAIKDALTVMKIIERSRLLQLSDLESARELSEQIPDSQDFLKALLKKKMVTRWQAGQLLVGNSSFFLGKYKLVELLGAGGMGRVFRAEHTTMNRPVALKIISRELVNNPDAQKRFLNEARAIALLNHPNIVHAYSVDKEGDRYYIVMEYVEGKELQKLVEEEGALEQKRIAQYMYQTASALLHAHERGMIHCDIKPANLLVNKDDQIKVLDMGLARFHSHEESSRSQLSELKQNVIGTVDYMAPEVAENVESASPQSDIYSLGCVMYFLLTGQIPFPADTIPERIIKHQSEEPKNPLEINSQLSPVLCELCLKMMAKSLDDRYKSCQEIMDALSEWLSEDGSESSSVSLDFSGLSAGDSNSSRNNQNSHASHTKKSGFFGKFIKGKEKDPKDSQIEAEKNKSTSSKISKTATSEKEHFQPFSKTDETPANEVSLKEKIQENSDDTIVASEEEITAAVAETVPQENRKEDPMFNSHDKKNVHPSENHPKLVQAVLLDDEEEDDDGEFVVLKKATVEKRTKKMEPVVNKKPSASRSSLNIGSGIEKMNPSSSIAAKMKAKKSLSWSDKNGVPEPQSSKSGAKSDGKSGAKLQTILQPVLSFFAALTPKQRIIYGSASGGVLLLVIILIVCLSGGGDEPKSTAKVVPDESVEEEVVEEVVDEVTDEENSETPAETPEGASAEKSEETPADAAAEKTNDAVADASAEKPAEKPEEAAADAATEKPAETPADASAEKPAEKPEEVAAETPADGATEKTAETPADASAEKPAEKPEEASADATVEKPAEKPAETPEAAPAETPAAPAADAEATKKAEEEAAKKVEEEAAAKKKADEEAAAKKKADEEAEAKKKAAAEPFKDSATIAPIPKPDSTEKFAITNIEHGGNDVTVSLLGGDVVFPVKAVGKKQPEQTKFFSIEPGEAEKTWEIKYKNKEEESKAAVLTLDENTLNFKWEPDEKIAPKDLPILSNCALKLECNEKSHVVALRQPLELPTITLNPKNGSGAIKGGKVDVPFPSPDAIYVEISRVGDFPADSGDLTLPEPAKASDINNKNPMKISFHFKDSNGNVQEAFFFDFVPAFGNGFAGNLTPGMPNVPKKAGDQLMAMIAQMQNPQIDIQVNQWKTEITNLEKKMEKAEAWQRDAKDTNQIAQLQMKIWLVDVAKQMGSVDFEFRVYAQYGESQIDLVTSRKMTEEELKAKKGGGKNTKKKAAEEAADESDDGGFKF